MHSGTEQDLSHAGRLLQAGRDVHRLARRERRIRLLGDDFPRFEPHPHLEAELGHGLADGERRPHTTLGIVLVRARDAEGGHDGVPGELLDHAAMGLDAVRDLVEEAVDAPAHDLASAVATRRVDSTRSTKRTVASFRSTQPSLRVGDAPASASGHRGFLRDAEADQGHAVPAPVPYDAAVLDPSVFKAYDVRGVYGGDLDEEGAYAIGRAYAEHFEPRSIAVGRDMRLSSPTMATSVIEGAADGGADVVDLGLVGTEMVYYAVGELGLEAVSASPPRTTRRSTRG